ncbi:MAG: hypothetical protein AB6733_10510 [Clostridiaceae bacterium]
MRSNKVDKLKEQIEEIDEWNKNANNPGHYINNGKVPLPTKNLFKSPIIIIILGLMLLAPAALNIINNKNGLAIFMEAIPVIVGIILICSGIYRLVKK